MKTQALTAHLAAALSGAALIVVMATGVSAQRQGREVMILVTVHPHNVGSDAEIILCSPQVERCKFIEHRHKQLVG